MDAKKYPALTATLVVFGLIALTGVVLAGIEYAGYSGEADKLKAADRKVTQLLSEPTAPTAENQKAAEDNLVALKAAEANHLKDLAGLKSDEFSNGLVTDPGQFTSNLTASVTNWRKVLSDAGVSIIPGRSGVKTDDFAFGFSRYYKTGVNPAAKVTQDLSRQSRIVDFLVRTLSEVKVSGDVLKLVSVDREPIELTPGTKTQNADEISGLSDPVFRREGIVTGQFFRVRFVGATDVLRRFVNAVAGSGRPLVIRGVDVSSASPDQLSTPQEGADATGATGPTGPAAGIFGDAPPAGATPAGAAEAAAPAGPQIVVQGSPSDITVTLEFIEPSKAEPAKPAEGAEGAAAAPETAKL